MFSKSFGCLLRQSFRLASSSSSSSLPPTTVEAFSSPTGTKRSSFDLQSTNAGIGKNDFSERRYALAEKLATQGPILGLPGLKSAAKKQDREHLVIIPSAQRRYMVDKIPYIFRQGTDFRYLTGSLSHNSAIVLKFNGNLEKFTTTLLLPEIDPREERWEGLQMRPDEACDVFGVDQAIHMDDLPIFLQSQISQSAKNLILWYDYLNPLHTNLHRIVMRFVEGSNVVAQPVQSPRQAVQQLRLIKGPKEIEAMRKTAHIGAEAITETIRSTANHMSETQIFAKLDYESRMRHADFLAYPPVVASGDNANTIHYTRYSKDTMNINDLILVDCGCDYGGYASDITRTWPISGKFETHQKLLYEAVLDIQLSLIEKLVNAAETESVDKLYRSMLNLLGEHLLDLGIITHEISRDEARLNAACSEFCPHHVSHYLGLDVHDTALISRNIPLEEGMIITMEPGIYSKFYFSFILHCI